MVETPRHKNLSTSLFSGVVVETPRQKSLSTSLFSGVMGGAPSRPRNIRQHDSRARRCDQSAAKAKDPIAFVHCLYLVRGAKLRVDRDLHKLWALCIRVTANELSEIQSWFQQTTNSTRSDRYRPVRGDYIARSVELESLSECRCSGKGPRRSGSVRTQCRGRIASLLMC